MSALKIIALFYALSFVLGCRNIPTKKRHNEIHKVVFATGGCFGTCPIQAIAFDSSLTVKYHGVKHTIRKGFFYGKITEGFWDTLNLKLEKMNYKQLDTSYQTSLDDLSTEIIIYYGNNLKHIFGQSASLPDTVMSTYRWILTSIDRLNLFETKDSLRFETIAQIPPPIPPRLEIDKRAPPKSEH